MIAVEEILSGIEDLNLKIETLTAAQFGAPEWFGLRAACKFKGVEYNSVKSDRSRQPRNGIADKMDGTKRYWHRSTIVEWSKVIDSTDWYSYQKKHQTEYLK